MALAHASKARNWGSYTYALAARSRMVPLLTPLRIISVRTVRGIETATSQVSALRRLRQKLAERGFAIGIVSFFINTRKSLGIEFERLNARSQGASSL